jgi:hypothetical protein
MMNKHVNGQDNSACLEFLKSEKFEGVTNYSLPSPPLKISSLVKLFTITQSLK